MRAHGEFTLEVVGEVVHTRPVGGFNVQGIEEYRNAILDRAGQLKDWVLFEHPRNIAWLTPESVESLLQTYHALAAEGCNGIAVEVSSVYQAVLEDKVMGRVTVPMLAGDNVDELDTFLMALLNR